MRRYWHCALITDQYSLAIIIPQSEYDHHTMMESNMLAPLLITTSLLLSPSLSLPLQAEEKENEKFNSNHCKLAFFLQIGRENDCM